MSGQQPESKEISRERILELSINNLRRGKAITTKEKRQKQVMLLGMYIELQGYNPESTPETEFVARIIKKVRGGKISPEMGAKNICKTESLEKLSQE